MDTPKQNAGAIAAALMTIGFTPEVEIDLDEIALARQINEFIRGLHQNDTVFLYFSGVALQTSNDNWLLPVNYQDAPLQAIGEHAYGLNLLLDQLNDQKVKIAIVVLDASRRCPNLAQTQLGLAPAFASEALQRPGLLLAFSAPSGNTVADPPDGGVNPFTKALIANLSTHGLKPVEVFDRTLAAVSALNGSIPWYQSSGLADYYLTGPPDPVVLKVERKPGELRPNPRVLQGINDAWIPPGTFQMGCVSGDRQCKPDETPAHMVRISKGFWMTATEVTVEAYKQFLEAFPNHRTPPPTKTNIKGQISNMPQTRVSWQDALDYCKWAGGAGGRLPTEAEWEYAARAGAKEGTVYPWGNDFSKEKANAYGTSKKKGVYLDTTPVGHYNNPNGFHLFDMAGNAREWTMDAYNSQAYQASNGAGVIIDPLVTQGLKTNRVVRGGDWNEYPKDLRMSARDPYPAESIDNHTGFRCVAPDAAP